MKSRRADDFNFEAVRAMAVNYCDGNLFASILLYPIMAVKGAASAGAGWMSLAFAPAGLAIGIAVVYFGRPIVYAILRFGIEHCGKIKNGWLKQFSFAPFALLYLILPWVFIGLGSLAALFGSDWLARQVF